QQHAIEAAQAEAALQQLALRALAAVDQKAAPFVHDEERRQPPLDRGHAAGSAKEHDLEQGLPRANAARPIMAPRPPIRKRPAPTPAAGKPEAALSEPGARLD